MQFKLALFTAALATLVAATPTPGGYGQGGGQGAPAPAPAPAPAGNTCSTGPMQCCNTLTNANDPAVASILHSIGAVVQDVNVGVGLTCSPILGVGSGGCSAQAVCCQNNSHGGLISIGCIPIQA
ncbi:hypothetical protein D9757_008576 [Collybiopsis confluens]|uniref:Hydrophobin n=1 Tax=Collybiopsis confluens TaxID=2823264 RepID=A0A8H5HNL8_9AGAR|nr:hypothetical protein D9757_008576 [Collybiopsis confluens]